MSLNRGIFYTFLTQVPTLVLYFVASTFMTRMLGDVGRGEYALITNHGALLSMLVSLNLAYGVTYFMAKANHDPRATIGVAATLLLVNILVVPVILYGISRSFAMSDLLMPPGRIHWFYWGYVYLSVILALVNGAVAAVLLALKRFKAINGMSLLNAVLSAIGFLVLYALRDRLAPADVFPAVLAVTLATMLLQTATWCVLYATLVRIPPVPTWAWSVLRPIVVFALVGHVSNVINLINYRFDVWVVEEYLGTASLGLYAVAVGVAQLLFYVPDPFSRVVQPYLFGQVKNEMLQRFKAIARLNFTAVLLLAIGLACTAQWIIPLLFGEVFRASVPALQLLLPGIVFSSTSKLLAQLVAQGNLQRFNLIGTAVAAAITVGLDLLLIPRWGIIGASVATTTAYLVILLIMLVTIRHRMGIRVSDLFLMHGKDIRHLKSMFSR